MSAAASTSRCRSRNCGAARGSMTRPALPASTHPTSQRASARGSRSRASSVLPAARVRPHQGGPTEKGGAALPWTIDDLDTPAVLVDLDRIETNLRRAQDYANEHGLRLRPHIKTHKIPELARR